jgi:4-aminobutyrate aminotransferase/(S)-3-amino-2-methylpropionate transaminase
MPGPVGARWVDLLARTECPALTTRRARRGEVAGSPGDPIVWVEARGANVRDADGNVYVDLTSGFGVATLGHAHPRVVEAVRRQVGRLMHALGDLHPSDAKVTLLAALAELAPFPDARVILGAHGADAVEAALKTAVLATGRTGVLAFTPGYHGLSYGALGVTGYQEAFRRPFLRQLNPEVAFCPYPRRGRSDRSEALARTVATWDEATRRWGTPPGAILLEPMLGRGGVVEPPAGFLEDLGALARDRGALLVVDEIFTGLGRTGAMMLSVAEGASPDLVCLGKALGGGMPMSACLGRAEVMAAWGDPTGAAIHTATFLGHPPACAASLAALSTLREEGLDARARALGDRALARLRAGLPELAEGDRVRGRGLVLGVELGEARRTLRAVAHLLERGFLVLPAGPSAEVLQLAPPLTISPALLDQAIDAVVAVVQGLPHPGAPE